MVSVKGIIEGDIYTPRGGAQDERSGAYVQWLERPKASPPISLTKALLFNLSVLCVFTATLGGSVVGQALLSPLLTANKNKQKLYPPRPGKACHAVLRNHGVANCRIDRLS